MQKGWRRLPSLQQRLIVCFAIIAILPLLANVFISFHNDRKQIIRNRDQIANMDVQQITQEFDTIIGGYEDVLYQLYTDAELSELLSDLDAGINSAVTRNQIRRKLHGVFWQKDHITSITVITQSGETAFYDRLSSPLQMNMCFDVLGMDTAALFSLISEHKGTLYFPTRYATHFAGEDYYLFFAGHRMINEKSITKTDAVILMSIDASLLQESLEKSQLQGNQSKYLFMLDDSGQLLWYPERNRIGEVIYDTHETLTGFVGANSLIDSDELAVYYRTSQRTGWQLVMVLDCATFTHAVDQRLALTVLITVVSFAIVIGAVWLMTQRMTASIDDLCLTMDLVSQGDLSIRAEIPESMTSEIRTLAEGLNIMADQLQVLIQSEQESAEKIKNAEIAALEAQLNPHFLYNTLDTINWMAIDQEQYPISNLVSALGKTLRYGIDHSNGIVSVEEEVVWLKQYLFIHQNRLKNSLHCQIEIAPEVLGCRVHKLLLQPFVENALIHGFASNQENCWLLVKMDKSGDKIHIEIADNGCGIPENILSDLNTTTGSIDRSKRYHGMQNAINRLILYYGADADVSVRSTAEQGTHIYISIPARCRGEV